MSGLASLLGRRTVVPAMMVAPSLRVTAAPDGAQTRLTVSGTILESVKVFRSLRAEARGTVIHLTAYAVLMYWHRGGSPDFTAVERLSLPPGTYRVVYDDGGGTPVDVGDVTVPG